jgi:hypothetical protein
MRRAAIAVLGVVLAAPAAAAPPGAPGAPPPVERVAVVALELVGDAAPALRAPLARRIDDELAGAEIPTVGYADAAARLAGRPDLVGCATTACAVEAGELLGVSHLIRVRVEAEGADYDVALELLRATDGGRVRRLEVACPVCTVADLTSRVGAAAVELVEGQGAEVVEVVLSSSPDGALLTVDGVALGRAPTATTLAVGPHRVRAELPGRAAAERTIEVRADRPSQPFELVLATGSDAGADRRFATWKWVAAGGALVAIGTGIALIAADGGGTCDGGGECERLYATGAAGWSTLALGAGLAGAAGWMFVREF